MHTVTVIYKSGAKVQIRCRSFKVTKGPDGLESVAWEEPNPRPLFFGVDEVAAVYAGKV